MCVGLLSINTIRTKQYKMPYYVKWIKSEKKKFFFWNLFNKAAKNFK